MPSDNVYDRGSEAQSRHGAMSRLLDAFFGFVVWAGHFLAIYIAEAVACQLGLGYRDRRVQSGFIGILAIATVLTAAVVLLHGFRRWRQRGEERAGAFLIQIAVGHDAVAAVAILWQLFAIFMVPICR
jgi:hypothetical protein